MPTVQAISVSRRGAAPSHCAAFADKVDWRTGDCLDKKTYADALEGASAVVVSVGSPPLPGDVEAARKANGATNVAVIEAAMEAKVGRAVVVGATMPPWLDKVAEGYALGKRDAFEALGVLRPGRRRRRREAERDLRDAAYRIGLPDPAGAGHGAAVLRA